MQLISGASWARARARLAATWSATDFHRPDVGRYARQLLLPATRHGLVTMAVLLLALQAATILLHAPPEDEPVRAYIFLVYAALCLQVILAVRVIDDTRNLNLLAMVYLVLSATALSLAAHRLGTFDMPMMTSSVLLVVAVPLVPWGLKEATIIVGLISFLFVASTRSVAGRFDEDALITLQFLLATTAVIALVLVARNAAIRKHDIRTRFDLEQAEKRQATLALTDSLTGAWNRRFLDENFDRLAAEARSREVPLELALLDVDDFKRVNDIFGHQTGDSLLKRLVARLEADLPGTSLLVRLGGDEFGVLQIGGGLAERLDASLASLESDPDLLRLVGGNPVRISAGVAQLEFGGETLQDELYRRADQALYAAKQRRPGWGRAGRRAATQLTGTGS